MFNFCTNIIILCDGALSFINITQSGSVYVGDGIGMRLPCAAVITTNGSNKILNLNFPKVVSESTGYDDPHFDLDISGADSDMGSTYASGDGTATHVYTVDQRIEYGASLGIDFNGDADSREDNSRNDLAAISSDSVRKNATTNEEVGSGLRVFPHLVEVHLTVEEMVQYHLPRDDC